MTSPNGENSLNWVTLWFVCFCYRISIEPLLLLLSLILVLSSWAYIFWSVQCDMIWRNFPLGQTFEPFVLNLTWQKNMSTIRQMLTVVSSRIMKKIFMPFGHTGSFQSLTQISWQKNICCHQGSILGWLDDKRLYSICLDRSSGISAILEAHGCVSCCVAEEQKYAAYLMERASVLRKTHQC